MDHSPPAFFKRGPAPLVRLFFFASLSLALLVIDARFRYAEGLRGWLALAAYPPASGSTQTAVTRPRAAERNPLPILQTALGRALRRVLTSLPEQMRRMS